MSDFDASGLAAEAMGDAADTAAGATETAEVAAEAASGAGGEGGVPDTTEETSIVHSLLFAPERGPTQRTFQGVGIDADPALALDGAVDWLLDVVGSDAGDELGDSLGPLGKMATGVGRMLTSDGAGDADRGDEGDGADDGADDEVGPVVA